MRIAFIAASLSAALGACAFTPEALCLDLHPNDQAARAACIQAAAEQAARREFPRRQVHRQDR